jgi:hypothetical protein
MHIALTGASGLIGSTLGTALAGDGQRVSRLVRRAPRSPDEVPWDPATGLLDPERWTAPDAVIHLAGENIAAGRWTRRRREMLRRSRVDATRTLVASLARLPQPPASFLCASAIGFYGERGDEPLTETSAPGTGFLADICRDWEQAAAAAHDFGCRVVHLRLGAVLARSGGMLPRLLTPFRLGVGGPVGHGRQYLSWIAIDDVVGAVQHILANPSLVGPVNLVAPEPITNAEFARELASLLHRPAWLRTPAFALRLALGQLADELILASTRVVPTVLLQSGYTFRFPRLAAALPHLLAAPAHPSHHYHPPRRS